METSSKTSDGPPSDLLPFYMLDLYKCLQYLFGMSPYIFAYTFTEIDDPHSKYFIIA